jgi:hypothetical protein
MESEANRYLIYGLRLESQFDLPELAASEEDAPADITIRRGSLEPVSKPESGSEKRRIESEPARCRLTYDSIGTFLVENGDTLVCDPDGEEMIDKKIFRRIVENQILAVALLQRGLLVLHGSAVVVNGRAAIFIGPRTAGKSTTAAAFYEEGYPVLGDDVIAIDFDGEFPKVVPGVPQIRLSPDAIDGLEIKETTRPVGDWGPDKRYRDVEHVDAGVPLGSVYVLRDGDRFECVEFEGQTPFFQLTAHTYAQGLLSESAMTATHFEQCATVLETAPVRLLRRIRNLDALPELVALVEADMTE